MQHRRPPLQRTQGWGTLSGNGARKDQNPGHPPPQIEIIETTLPWELEEIAALFCDEVLTSVQRSFDVLKPERQRRVLPKPRA
jgi:hypothetical protein